tara:strand:+ start:6877 stop:7656 length:780 start_codon:yes stop_codon:yes gene_type:complete
MTSSYKNLNRREFFRAGASVAAASSFSMFTQPDMYKEIPDFENEKSLFKRLQEIPTPLIMDAMARLGADRTSLAMSGNIRPMIRSKGTIIGPAVTTKYEISDQPTRAQDIRDYVFKPVDEAAPGSIWVNACGTTQILSMFGDVIVLACHKKGLSGLVTDGGCRDIEGIEQIGLPVYAAGTCLYGPGSVIRPVGANVPVVCGGLEIIPGGIVAADVNGIMTFPRVVLPDIVSVIEELRNKENQTRRDIEKGSSLNDAYVF